MKSVEVKLRRYQRIKRRKKSEPGFTRFCSLYWRYHFKVYGPPVCLYGGGRDEAG